jgi:hypothetical protein
MKHILKHNSSYFGTSVEKTIDPVQKLLESGIDCQFFNHSKSVPSIFKNVTLIPTTPNQCTWKWIQDGAKNWDGAFNISLHQTQEPSPNVSDQNKGLKSGNGPEQDVMMALTCWLPSPSSLAENPLLQKIRRKSMKDGEQRVATKPGVTFAAPFILRKPFESNIRQLNPRDVVFDRNTLIATLSVIVSLILCIFVIVLGYRCIQRKRDKR